MIETRSGSAIPRALTLRKKLLFVALIGLAPPLLGIALIEVVGRVVIHFKYGHPGKSYGIYMADAELGATHRPNSYNSNTVINDWGFRNVDDIEERKPAGATRVYCSGGSTTYCYNLMTEEAWPSRLQVKLRGRQGHERDEVLNAGQICFPVASEFALARRMIPKLKPDIVVVFTAVNEVLGAQVIGGADGRDFDQLLRDQIWGVVPKHLDQSRFLKRESVLVRLIDYRFKSWFESRLTADYRAPDAKPQPVHPWVTQNFEHTLRSYLDFLHAQGVARVIVVRWGDSGADSWHMEELRRMREDAVAIAREKGAEVFDFSVVAAQRPDRASLYISSGIHLTKSGAELFAQTLADFILGANKGTLAAAGPSPSE